MSRRLSKTEKLLTALAIHQHIERLVARGMPYRKAVLATLAEIKHSLLSERLIDTMMN
jgi:hypothetical protein